MKRNNKVPLKTEGVLEMIKRFVAAFAIVVVMVIAGSMMYKTMPDLPDVYGEVVFDDVVYEGKVDCKIIKVNEDLYRIQMIYTRKGLEETFRLKDEGKVTGFQMDMAVTKDALNELIETTSELSEVKL